jgi:tetratricopeptide (TPR) repeat protein
VGEVIDELYPDRLAEFVETLAWHYAHGEAWDKAVHYLLEATAKAGAQFAVDDGLRYANEAVAILDRHLHDDAARVRALEAVGDLESLLGRLEQANAAYARAAEAAPSGAARERIENKRHREGVAVTCGRILLSGDGVVQG